jgi:hypothetical protein
LKAIDIWALPAVATSDVGADTVPITPEEFPVVVDEFPMMLVA